MEQRPTVVIVPPREVDPASIDEFRKAFASLDGSNVEVDCSEVEFMDSTGVRELLLATAAVRERGGDLRVLNPTVIVRRLLEVTDLDSLIIER